MFTVELPKELLNIIFKYIEFLHNSYHFFSSDRLAFHQTWGFIVEDEFLLVNYFKTTNYSWFSKVFFKVNILVDFVTNFIATLKNKLYFMRFIHFIGNSLIRGKKAAFQRIHDTYHEVTILFRVVLIIRIFHWLTIFIHFIKPGPVWLIFV